MSNSDTGCNSDYPGANGPRAAHRANGGPSNGRVRVAVIFGGRSGEHEVSLASAASVMGAIDRDKYDVVPIGITRQGAWITAGDPLRALREGATAETTALALVPTPGSRELLRLADDDAGEAGRRLGRIDVVFPVLHGPMGEDGTIQGLLEIADVPYVGSGVLASAVGMDKDVMKRLFRQHGLPVARYEKVLRWEWERDPDATLLALEARFGYPCFVKPANMGSSVGVTKAHDREELRAGLELAARYDRKLIVEEFIAGREIECSVLGNDEPIASVPGEVRPGKEFYDYEAKYTDNLSEIVVPADLPPEVAECVRRLAIEAFKALDCAGMARVDFFLRAGDGQLFLNELNTIPGFTPYSMYARMWAASGLDYPALVDQLIQLALERHADSRRHRTG